MDPVHLVKFDRNRQIIRGYPIQKKAHLLTLEVPHMAQFLSVEDQSHEGTLMLWVMQSTEPNHKVPRKILVTYEERPFDVEDTTCEESEDESEATLALQYIGMWVDHYVEDGRVGAITGHVLEILGALEA